MKFRKMTAVLAACILAVSANIGLPETAYSGTSLQAAADATATGTYGNLTYVSTGSAITITQCDANATYEVIPEEIDGLPVTKIDSNAFENCTKLVGVIVPESVTTIGIGAFAGCTALVEATIADSVTSIGTDAFSGCTSLTTITLSENVANISGNLFAGCTALKSLTLPSGTKSIGYNAFDGCTALSDITLPDTVQTIGSAAFTGCTSLTEMAIPDAVLSVGDSAFEGCTALETVKLGSAIKVLGGLAFADCSALTAINIPASVTTIGDGVFRNSLAMTSLTVNSSNTKYKAVENVLFSADMTQLIAYPAGLLEYCYTVPKTVTDIHDYAFYGNLHLTEITFPNTLATIGANAFYSDEGVTNIEKVFWYDSAVVLKKPICFDEGKPQINMAYEGNDGNLFVIYRNANGRYCFANEILVSWSMIVGGYQVTVENENGETIFYNELSHSGEPIMTLYKYEYSGSDLEKVEYDTREISTPAIEAGTYNNIEFWFETNYDQSLFDYYFYSRNDGYLVEFIYDGSGMITKQIVEIPKTDEQFLSSIAVGDSNDLAAEFNYYTVSFDTTPNETDALSYESFTYHQYDSSVGICGYDTSLTTAVLPDKIDRLPVTAIEDMAFYRCNDLQSVTISDNVATIGEYAFYFNSELETVVIPYSVSAIDASAFAGCTDLKDVYYNGSEEEWAAITVGGMNECLLNATIHFNSTGPEPTTEPETYTLGDVNLDDKVSVADVISVNKFYMKTGDLTELQQTAGDCNHDGSVDLSDSLLILKSLIGLVTLS